MDRDRDLVLQRIAIEKVGSLIPRGAENKVAETIRQVTRPARESIRTETALQPFQANIPIKIEPGFPIPVALLIERNPDPTLWRLVSLRPYLFSISDGARQLLAHWPEIENWPYLPKIAKNGSSTLNSALEISESLRSLAAIDRLVRAIREIDKDILGTYWPGSHIEIYWMAIALFAGAFDLRTEDLTAVTVIHELAHAYTHLGLDIKGTSWNDVGFDQSEPAVIEGLAQYYTATVTQKLSNRFPLAHQAYRTLLEYQPEIYRSHETWFESGLDGQGEIVRSALLQARTAGDVTDERWRVMLRQAQVLLSK
jgi:hypothetical protein